MIVLNDIKLLKDLTKDDILKFKIWEHWIENRLEYVKPTKRIQISESENKGFIVQTDFELKNNSKFSGFSSPMDTSGLDYIQPVIITERGQVLFWKDEGWKNDEKEIELSKLGLKQSEVFPISYKSLIPIDGIFYKGVIEDFNKGR